MIQFTFQLKKEIDAKIEQIECSEISMINKSLEASHILTEAFNQLKVFILSYTFKDEEEEIFFFKETKPRFCSRLIYYRKVYNIEMNRPAGIEKQREYLSEMLNDINRYNCKRLDFMRYYRSSSSHLDSLYFLRGQTNAEQYLETFRHEFDHNFSTNCDFKVAKILANDMLSAYLMDEIELLTDNGIKIFTNGFPATKITWMGSKAELQEQIFSWDCAGTFGKVPQTQLFDYIQNVFNIQLDRNFSRSFDDLKIRNTPTPFLDKLKNALLRRMGRK
ncbi:RteC domain-containing protein [Bacteroides ovatus]|uniref:RteC domain-containing protein n=1 Tax=Bacteroides ovatus TaxID=28116 RepID=UPI001CDBDA5B|nr:RteC domain-containing protein [Bacteroides ovatus]MCA4529047.1 RteC domain-containing protein [Bacteroides ovatus]MCA4542688.1 RteC domain-containing protein [Bacteroides ovatus]MCA4575180.1 RteC domain-containing protein [Bacteroides ovatus]